MKELEEFNYFFGYTNHPEKENPVKIFDYKEHSEKSLEQFEGYKKHNERTTEWILKNQEEVKKIKYHVNAPQDLIVIERPYYPGKLIFDKFPYRNDPKVRNKGMSDFKFD